MSNVLFISGHPKSNSMLNDYIISNLQKKLSNATIDILNLNNNNYEFNITQEQSKIIKADVIVFQFPVYWGSTPFLLKKWIEDVFTKGFAYGNEKKKLANKTLIVSLTFGSIANNISIRQVISPLQSFSNYCHMRWGGFTYIDNVKNKSHKYIDNYCKSLIFLIETY